MKVQTQNFAIDGGVTIACDQLARGTYFAVNHAYGDISPNFVAEGNYDDINQVVIIQKIKDQNNNTIRQDISNANLSVINGKIHYEAYTDFGFAVIHGNYNLEVIVQVFYTYSQTGSPTGIRTWSAWRYNCFPLNPIPSVQVMVNMDVMPTKPIHKISINVNYDANGATIIQRRIWYKKQGDANWTQLSISGENPFFAYIHMPDGVPPITYEISGEVQYETILFDVPVTYWKTEIVHTSYLGEGTELPIQ